MSISYFFLCFTGSGSPGVGGKTGQGSSLRLFPGWRARSCGEDRGSGLTDWGGARDGMGGWDGGGAFCPKIHAFFAFWDAKTPSGTGAGLKNGIKCHFPRFFLPANSQIRCEFVS